MATGQRMRRYKMGTSGGPRICYQDLLNPDTCPSKSSLCIQLIYLDPVPTKSGYQMYLLFLLIGLTSAFAMPAKRSCAVQYPRLRSDPSKPLPYSISLRPGANPLGIGFTIPDSAAGPCSLMLSLPASVQGVARVNVVALDGPAPGALVGTTTFTAGGQATINSFACRPQMCYSLQVTGDQAVGFQEGGGWGVVMTYDC